MSKIETKCAKQRTKQVFKTSKQDLNATRKGKVETYTCRSHLS
jgi:hypothetical protein